MQSLEHLHLCTRDVVEAGIEKLQNGVGHRSQLFVEIVLVVRGGF